MDFLEKVGSEINFETGKLAQCATNEEPPACATHVERAALSVSRGKCRTQPSAQTA